MMTSAELVRFERLLEQLILRELLLSPFVFLKEFFSRDLWEKLPRSWQLSLTNVTYTELALILQGRQSSRWIGPLSLLALVKAVCALSLPRQIVDVKTIVRTVEKAHATADTQPDSHKISSEEIVTHSFSRHVKPKKLHEIEHLGQLVSGLCERKGVDRVLDVGCGQGHLSRLLAYRYGLNVSGIEAIGSHIDEAQSLDQCILIDKNKQERRQQETTSPKLMKEQKFSSGKLQYITCEISPTICPKEFISCLDRCQAIQSHSGRLPSAVQQSQSNKNPFFLTGLHTCGDLGPTILKLFACCHEAQLLALVSCCYMKMEHLDCSDEDEAREINYGYSYPLSSSLRKLPAHHLSYRAKELACHNIDGYCQRLKANDTTLKLHCYRAAVQCLLNKKFPGCAHKNIRTIRRGGQLGITEYAKQALMKIGLPADLTPEDVQLLESLIKYEVHAVAFYCLHLMFGPIVETILLLDRLLFLKEQGLSASVLPLFESSQSPRCHVIVCSK